MVLARTKMMIQDDLLTPRNKAIIEFEGPNPERFYKELPELMSSVFRVHTGQIQEKAFSWSKGDPEKFKVDWVIDKDLDKFSFLFIQVSLKGTTSAKGGKAMVTIDGELRTEYPQDTVWEKSLLYEFMRMAWHQVFYDNKRHEYYKEGRMLIAQFIEELKKLTHAQL